MEFLTDYGLFFAKSVTVIVVIGLILAMVASVRDSQDDDNGQIKVVNLNDRYKEYRDRLRASVLDEQAIKAELKQEKKKAKEQKKLKNKDEAELKPKRRVYVIDFDGDIRASAAASLKEEITAVLAIATIGDEVVIKLESGGGMVHGYGFAASQMDRVASAKIPLTVCVDKVAASGGYMMACVADKILAAPFAIVGSIGVVAQLPNFHRLLKKNDVDVEILTAGEHKRTLTMFGENTDKGREKFIEELEETHQLFKDYVGQRRDQVDLGEVSTGEVWYGARAVDKGLVDQVMTSDEYLVGCCRDSDVYEVSYETKKSFGEKMGLSVESGVDNLLLRWWDRMRSTSKQQF